MEAVRRRFPGERHERTTTDDGTELRGSAGSTLTYIVVGFAAIAIVFIVAASALGFSIWGVVLGRDNAWNNANMVRGINCTDDLSCTFDPNTGTESIALAVPVTICSPRNYGAVGDGVADDAVSMQAAFSACNIIDGGGLTYSINSALTVPAGRTIQNMNLDFRAMNVIGVSSTNYITIASGTASSTFALSADLLVPGLTATTSSAFTSADFTVNDYVQLQSTEAYSATGPVTMGELAQIQSVNTTAKTITLKEGVHLPYYTASSASIRKISFTEGVNFRNVRIQGNSTGLTTESVRCILATYLLRSEFDALELLDCYSTGLQLTTSLDVAVRNSKFSLMTKDGFAYGIAIVSGSAYIFATDNYCEDVRHCLTTGGTSGVNYQIHYRGNDGYGCHDACYDMHPASYSGSIIGNSVTCLAGRPPSGNADGIMSQGAGIVISNNDIIGCPQYSGAPSGRSAIHAQLLVTSANVPARTTTIQGNTIQQADIGIQVTASGSAAQALQSLAVSGNTITDFGTRGIHIVTDTQSILSATISGNALYSSVASSTTTGIDFSLTAGTSIAAVSAIGNSIVGTATTTLRAFQVINAASSAVTSLVMNSNVIQNVLRGIVWTNGDQTTTFLATGNVAVPVGSGIVYNSALKPVTRSVQGNVGLTADATVTGTHFESNSAAPTIACGTGAQGVGTGTCTITASSTDTGQEITVLTAGTPAASSTIFTVTFSQAYTNTMNTVVCSPANQVTAALSGATAWSIGTCTTASWVMTSGTTGLTTGTTYKWKCSVVAS